MAWRRRVVRRTAAFACLGIAASLLVSEPRPSPERRHVVVAVRTVPAGGVVQAEDVVRVERPVIDLPANATTEPKEVIGTVASVTITPGEVITSPRVLGDGLLRGLPAGWLAVPVPVRDVAALAIVHPGDRVDLFAPEGPDLDVTDVVVLGTLGHTSTTSSDSMMPGAAWEVPPTVVVALDTGAARRVNTAAVAGNQPGFGVAVHPRLGADATQ